MKDDTIAHFRSQGTGISRALSITPEQPWTPAMLRHEFKEGSVTSSVLALIVTTFGVGTITLPYLAAANGIVYGAVMIIFAAFISHFTSMLLTKCAAKVQSNDYEDFARYSFGNKAAVFTAWCNIFTMLGFVISYIVFIMVLIPHIYIIMILNNFKHQETTWGSSGAEIATACAYTLLVLFPISLCWRIGALRHFSLFAVLCSVYIVICVVCMFFFDKNLVDNRSRNIKEANYLKPSFAGVLTGVPFVMFAFMYQPSVPIIYRELTDRSYDKMKRVSLITILIVIILYVIMGTFGYLGILGQPKLLEVLLDKKNILELDFNNYAFYVGIICLVISIMAATPMSIIIAKDIIARMMFKEEECEIFTIKNFLITLLMVSVCLLLAITVPGIAEMITILGFTTNPMSGFILPIAFYLKIFPEASLFDRICCWVVLTLVIVTSAMVCVMFVQDQLE